MATKKTPATATPAKKAAAKKTAAKPAMGMSIGAPVSIADDEPGRGGNDIVSARGTPPSGNDRG